MKDTYDDKFYAFVKETSLNSAREVVPLVVQLIQPQSVVDIGCGIGAWLSVFRELGVETVLGIDGDWVTPARLLIPHENFMRADLTQPWAIDRPFPQSFDLVVSLEVAEHLPEACAAMFVNSIVQRGSVVLFSAAIPLQGGENHVNEQWPGYWIRLFAERGYVAIDCLRSQVWNNDNVAAWFAQNVLIFVDEQHLDDYPLLKTAHEKFPAEPLPLVHPGSYQWKCEEVEALKQELEDLRRKCAAVAADSQSD